MFCSIFPPSQLTCCCHENAFYCLWLFDFSDVPRLTSFVMWVSQYSDGHSNCTKFQCFKCAQKTFCSSSKECPPPTVGPWNFSKCKILYHVLHMCVCVYIYIYIYIYICPWCALWINQLLILWCYKQTCYGTCCPQTQPYSSVKCWNWKAWTLFPLSAVTTMQHNLHHQLTFTVPGSVGRSC